MSLFTELDETRGYLKKAHTTIKLQNKLISMLEADKSSMSTDIKKLKRKIEAQRIQRAEDQEKISKLLKELE